MSRLKRTAGVALATGSVLLASACTGSGASTATQTGSATPAPTNSSVDPSDGGSPTVTSSASPTPDPDSPQVRSAAVLDAYFKVRVSCLRDPQKTPMTCFDSVAISSSLNDLRNSLISAKTAYTKVIGSVDIVWVKQKSIDLTNKPKQSPPYIPIVTYSVCYDVSKLNIVDAQGKSIVPPDRKSRGVETVAVANYQYPKPTGWRVAYTIPTKQTC